MTIIPYYDCPRFGKRNVNKCPLDPNIDLKNSVLTDEKCNIEKRVRYRIGSKYPNLLKYQGLTKREWFGKQLSDKYHAQTEIELKQGDKSPKNAEKPLLKAIGTIITIFILISLSSCTAYAEIASYYTVESCYKESGQCIMANGKRLRNEKLTCASWDYPFGTLLLITNEKNNTSVICEVTDRGPARKLYKKGIVIDLSYAAMDILGGVKSGIIEVKIEKVN